MVRFVAIFVALLIAAPTLAQCPGGVCPSPYGGGSGRRSVMDAPAPQQTPPLECRCRIACPDGSMGSGTLVCQSIVITANHVVRDSGGSATVIFPSGARASGRVIDKDEFYDLAAIEIQDCNAQPATIGTDTSGVLVAAGFGGDGSFRIVRGSITGYVYYDNRTDSEAMPKMSGAVRPGDSGGGVVNANKEFVGVVWGEVGGETYITCGRPLQAFVQRTCGRRCLPSVQPQQPSVAAPPKQPATPLPAPTIDPSANCEKQAADIAALRTEIASLKTQISQYKECNCDGCCDKVRAELNAKIETLAQSQVSINNTIQQFEQRQPETPNYDQIAAEVAKRLPPINMRVNPSAAYQPVKLGQYVTLPLDKK